MSWHGHGNLLRTRGGQHGLAQLGVCAPHPFLGRDDRRPLRHGIDQLGIHMLLEHQRLNHGAAAQFAQLLSRRCEDKRYCWQQPALAVAMAVPVSRSTAARYNTCGRPGADISAQPEANIVVLKHPLRAVAGTDEHT